MTDPEPPRHHWRARPRHGGAGLYTLAFFAAVVLVAAGFFLLGQRASRNTDAVKTSCTLLSNAIIQSGGQNAGAKVLVKEILLNAEEHGRPEVVIQYRRAVAHGARVAGELEPPDCDKIAEDPAAVTAVPQTTPTPAHK